MCARQIDLPVGKKKKAALYHRLPTEDLLSFAVFFFSINCCGAITVAYPKLYAENFPAAIFFKVKLYLDVY